MVLLSSHQKKIIPMMHKVSVSYPLCHSRHPNRSRIRRVNRLQPKQANPFHKKKANRRVVVPVLLLHKVRVIAVLQKVRVDRCRKVFLIKFRVRLPSVNPNRWINRNKKALQDQQVKVNHEVLRVMKVHRPVSPKKDHNRQVQVLRHLKVYPM